MTYRSLYNRPGICGARFEEPSDAPLTHETFVAICTRFAEHPTKAKKQPHRHFDEVRRFGWKDKTVIHLTGSATRASCCGVIYKDMPETDDVTSDPEKVTCNREAPGWLKTSIAMDPPHGR